MGEVGTAWEQPGHRMERDLLAVKPSKICNDLRLLSSGPAAGFGDITLPAVHTVTNSAGLATALSPYLGYAAASVLARDAQVSNRPVRELAQERGLLPPEVIDALLADPHRLTGTAGPQDATATRLSAGPPTTITGGTA